MLGPYQHLGCGLDCAKELQAFLLEMSPFSAMHEKQSKSSISHKQVKCLQTSKEAVITKSDRTDAQRRCYRGRANGSV